MRQIIKATVSNHVGQGGRAFVNADKAVQIFQRARTLAEGLRQTRVEGFEEFAIHLLAGMQLNNLSKHSKDIIGPNLDVILANLDAFLTLIERIKNPRTRAEVLEGLAELLNREERGLEVLTKAADSYLECRGERYKKKGRELIADIEC